MSFKKIVIATTLLVSSSVTLKAQLIINEFMQSNIDCIMDDLNEFPDSWIELYNSGNAAVNLSQYQLGVTNNAAEAWQLPNQSVASHQYVLLYCDKEDTGLHAPFRIDSGKSDGIWLFHQGNIIDQITDIKKQPAPNIAFGRLNEGSNEWGYQATATPGKSNCGQVCDKLLGDPVFSEPGKVLTGSHTIQLTISLPEGAPANTEIRVTYDGSEPTRTSLLLDKPITISQTRIVRAKLFCDGWLSAPSVTQSYIFFPRDLTLPVVSVTTDNKYLNDNKIGIYVDGNYKSGKKNYEFNWRRPINFEYFEEEGKASALNQLCETRIQGGATRGNKMKSLALYANKRFGTKRFTYEFFPDQKPGITDFKSILLRNAGNDFDYLFMRDIIAQRTMGTHTDLDWQAWKPVIVYINGKYNGMLNIRERANDDNIFSNYNHLEDIDAIENWWDLKNGDMDHFNAFKEYFNEHGHSMADYEKWMDCKEFINLMVMNIYFNNIDFPGNNFMMWRPRTADGRWRFIAKDVDYIMNLYNQGADYNYKYINWLYYKEYDYTFNWGANDYEDTRLFRRLMEDNDFKREFIDRFAIYMGDFLNEQGIWEVWEPMYNTISTEYPNHRKLINEWWPNYQEEMTNARNWIKRRSDFMYQHLADYYELNTPTPLVVNSSLEKDDLQTMAFSFNDVPLSKGTFDGKYYLDHPIKIEGKPLDGKEVMGWNLTVINSSNISKQHIDGATCQLSMPNCSRLLIEAELRDITGIQQIENRQWQWFVNNDALWVNQVPQGTRVLLYNTQGMLLHQSVSDGGDLQFALPHDAMFLLKVGKETIKIRR